MGAYDNRSPEIQRILRRKLLIWYIVRWAILTPVCGLIVFAAGGAILVFCGDNAWPSAVFFSLLALYCASVYWRYLGQEPDEEDYFFHPDD